MSSPDVKVREAKAQSALTAVHVFVADWSKTGGRAFASGMLGARLANVPDIINEKIKADCSHDERVKDVGERREIDPMVKVAREGPS